MTRAVSYDLELGTFTMRSKTWSGTYSIAQIASKQRFYRSMHERCGHVGYRIWAELLRDCEVEISARISSDATLGASP
jgi:hypothetical protein